MKNLIQQGDVLTIVVPTGTATVGTGILVGGLFGVIHSTNNNKATGTAADADNLTINLTGVYRLAKATGASTGVTQGGPVYWDNTAKLVTGVSTSNTLIGKAWVAAVDGDATLDVRLNG